MRSLTVTVVLLSSTLALAGRPQAPAGVTREIQKNMEETIRMGTTPSIQIFPHNDRIKFRTSRAPNYPAEIDSPNSESWAVFRVSGPRSAAARKMLTVKLRALLPVSGHVYRPGSDSFTTAKRFGKSTKFRLTLVHEDGSYVDLGNPTSNGIVTLRDLALPLRPGRNLLVMLPESTDPTDRKTFVWRYRSGRVVEFVWGTPQTTPVHQSPMRSTLQRLGLDPFPPANDVE